ncbi:MAG: PRTRC system ThiF family protein [Pedobacter sp.]|nr:MAG: PRTRC system ThiF family protein [Pedobacter sp.]
MKKQKQKVHIVPQYLLNPTNPVSVNLIGAGGTGSSFLTALARMNYALNELGHCGISVRLFDHDIVEQSNLGRQLFNEYELGMNKAVALINRVNRFFGTNWKAVTQKFESVPPARNQLANITISCVDTVSARKEISEFLNGLQDISSSRDRLMYWLDLGNGRDSGQVWLSTIGEIKQPESKKFKTVGLLSDIFSTYPNLMETQEENNEPSCSLAQALNRQDLFINSVLSNMGASLLWSMFRLGVLENRGLFLSLGDFRSTPVPI